MARFLLHYRGMRACDTRPRRLLLGVFRFALAALLLGVGLSLAAQSTHATESVAGTYVCSTIEVNGKSEPCKAPPIELYEDGSYTILSESGTYRVVSEQWLVLSSKKRGRARLDGTKGIIFDFISSGKNKRITYRRKFEAPPGWLSA